jgi:hypothetical protein
LSLGVRALAQQLDTGAHRRGASGRNRNLLADDGRQVGGEGQEERLDLPPLDDPLRPCVFRPIRDAVIARPVELRREADPVGEAEDGGGRSFGRGKGA